MSAIGFDIVEAARKLTQSKERVPQLQGTIKCGRFALSKHQSQRVEYGEATLVLSDASRGRLRMECDGAKFDSEVRPGILTFAPHNVRESYDFEGRTTNTILSIDSSLFERAEEADPGLGNMGGLEPRAAFVRPRLQSLIQEQYQVMSSGEAGWRLLSESIALRIAYELLTMFNGEAAKKAGALPLSQAELGQLIDFIEAEMESNFGLSEMAQLLDRDPFGFARAFKAATGESPHQFVIHRRLGRVKELLAHTAEPLAEIAYATGFSSQSHMTATFTKHVGLPPGAYRKKVRT